MNGEIDKIIIIIIIVKISRITLDAHRSQKKEVCKFQKNAKKKI